MDEKIVLGALWDFAAWLEERGHGDAAIGVRDFAAERRLDASGPNLMNSWRDRVIPKRRGDDSISNPVGSMSSGS